MTRTRRNEKIVPFETIVLEVNKVMRDGDCCRKVHDMPPLRVAWFTYSAARLLERSGKVITKHRHSSYCGNADVVEGGGSETKIARQRKAS